MPASDAGQNPSRRTAIIWVSLVSFLISLIFITPLFSSFELKAYDLLSRHFNPAQGSTDIMIVQIDQPSLDRFEKDFVYWPWPRSMYVAMLDFLKTGGARTVVFGHAHKAELRDGYANPGSFAFPTSAERTYLRVGGTDDHPLPELCVTR